MRHDFTSEGGGIAYIFIYSYIQVNGAKFSIKGQIELVKVLQNGHIATQGL